MTLSLTIAWWWAIPLIVTLLCLLWIGFWTWIDLSSGGWFAGVGALIMSTPALALIALVWVIGAMCK